MLSYDNEGRTSVSEEKNTASLIEAIVNFVPYWWVRDMGEVHTLTEAGDVSKENQERAEKVG